MSARDLILRLRALLAPRRAERDLEDELASHIEMETHRQLAAGLSPADARARARSRFGSISLTAEQCRDARGVTFIDTCVRDVLYALRSFRRAPTVAIAVVATIALGLGLMAAVFTVFNAAVFRTEPVRDPEALLRYSWSTPAGERHQFTFKEYTAFRRENQVFADVLAMRPDATAYIDGRLANGHLVTGNYFQVFGVGAALGRTLMPEDAAAFGSAPVVVLSDSGWRRLFAGDPDVVGRSIQIRGFRFDVVGVAPKGFGGGLLNVVDFWAPLTMVDQLERRPWQPLENPGGLQIIGRLKPGMSAAAARAALAPWSASASAPRSTGVWLEPASTGTLSLESVLSFSPLFFAFGLILLIACANVANLMLARAVARQREIAIRLALGASRRRVVRQLLTESLVLALAAGGCALLISSAVVDLITRVLVTTMPPELAEMIRLGPLPTDIRVVVFVVVAAAVAAAAFGLLPALQATRTSLHQAARGTARPGRARSMLIVVQIAASTLLLICAGLMLRSAQRATARDPGIRMSDTIIINSPPDDRTRPAIVAALSSEPTVEALVAAWPGAPILDRPKTAAASTAGSDNLVRTSFRVVSSNYFDVLDIAVLSGRAFTNEEAAAHAAVAVVSESAARHLWSGEKAIGQTVRLSRAAPSPDDNDRLTTPRTAVVIGVVRDVRGIAERGDGSDGTGIYLPTTAMDGGTTLMARARGDVEVARKAITERVTSVEPRINLILSMRTLGSLQTYPLRAAFWLMVVLGALALALTLSGIYGVLSFLVVQRTKEIGVRIALGATPAAVRQLVLSQSMRMVGVGLAIGTSVVWSVSAFFMTKMPAEGPFAGTLHLLDGVAYVGGAMTILTACLLAASIPARRAARIDPIATLKHD